MSTKTKKTDPKKTAEIADSKTPLQDNPVSSTNKGITKTKPLSNKTDTKKFKQFLNKLKIVQTKLSGDVNRCYSIFLKNAAVDERSNEEKKAKPFPKNVVTDKYMTKQQKSRINRSLVNPYRNFTTGGHMHLNYCKMLDVNPHLYDIKTIIQTNFPAFVKDCLLNMEIINTKGQIIDPENYIKVAKYTKIIPRKDLQEQVKSKKFFMLDSRAIHSTDSHKMIMEIAKKIVVTVPKNKMWKPQTFEDIKNTFEASLGIKFEKDPIQLDAYELSA